MREWGLNDDSKYMTLQSDLKGEREKGMTNSDFLKKIPVKVKEK